MKDKILEQNKELLLSIFLLSGIRDISLENIQSLDLGGRSFCYICKNTEKGDLFIKIDMELEAFSFVDSFRERDRKRKEELNKLLEEFSQQSGSVAKVFYKTTIPSFIDGRQTPQHLVDQPIIFSK